MRRSKKAREMTWKQIAVLAALAGGLSIYKRRAILDALQSSRKK